MASGRATFQLAIDPSTTVASSVGNFTDFGTSFQIVEQTCKATDILTFEVTNTVRDAPIK